MDSLIQKKIKEIELDKYDFSVNNFRIENYLKSIGGDISNLKERFENNDISL